LTIPPSQPGRASRATLAARLTELRAAAGLSGNALAKRMGVVQSRVNKIEHPEKPPHLIPNEDDIRAWVAATTGDERTVAELMGMLAKAEKEKKFSALFGRKGGAVALEERVRAAEEQATRIGEFEVAVIPGILQTADYARELLGVASGPRAWGSDDADVEDKISSRLRRQEVLYDSARRIQIVLGEGALRTLVSTPEVHIGQMDKLLAASRLPAVELGVIGFSQRMPAYPLGFRIYDNDLIVVESLAGERDFAVEDEPAEVATFVGAFEALRKATATGERARHLIVAAVDSLRRS
jgi:transcriptional regulator with XRE-family HTH domain